MSYALYALSLATLWGAGDIPLPKAADPRIEVELFAADPDIVTPCGIAIDARGRVLCVESHTHFPPQGYAGPKFDRVRMFEDTNDDGKADRITNFFEGTTWTMNVAVHPDGSVYLATRNEILRLRDTNDDGQADERKRIVHLETKGNYPHNGLSGFAFDFNGDVYFGLGENLGVEFKLIGTDGSSISDIEGGQIYHCKADGSQVERVAFGFWNPFHMTLDAFGRLFMVDNDPDSLPPCRLAHVVSGGNYGYRYRNGRKGVHPFTAWNGELPGTLPMMAGTGEAPSGIVSYESDQLPAEYIGDLLSTSWGDHRVERFRPKPRGASFSAVSEPFLQGGEEFRPVGIVVAPDGSLFISDWVKRDYEVHGNGRIWHVTAPHQLARARPLSPVDAIHSADRTLRETAARQLASDSKTGQPLLRKLAVNDAESRVRAVALLALQSAGISEPLEKAALSDPSVDVRTLAIRQFSSKVDRTPLLAANQPAEVRAEALRGASDKALLGTLTSNLSDSDAFIAQAARQGLSKLKVFDGQTDFSKLPAAERLAAALILRESGEPQARAALPRLLADPDAAVRFAAIQWVGEEGLTEFREPLLKAVSAGPATARLFGGYLAALERLDGVVRESSNEWGGEQYIVRALNDPKTSLEVRRFGLRMLRPDHPLLTIERLGSFLTDSDTEIRLEAVRSLRDSPHAEKQELLHQIAADGSQLLQLRAEAIVGLTPDNPTSRAQLLAFASGDEPTLRNEALRSLRGAEISPEERAELAKVAARDLATADLVARVVEPGLTNDLPPDDVALWIKLLNAGQGRAPVDPAAGERIFFHAKSAGCSRCHQIAGRGARVGPELTAVTGALAQERLIESIVRPSKEVAPQFVAWQLATNTGRTVVGTLVHLEATGEQTYADNLGKLHHFAAGEIESRQSLPTSIMPDGLAKQLTLQEFRDLLAYLQSQ